MQNAPDTVYKTEIPATVLQYSCCDSLLLLPAQNTQVPGYLQAQHFPDKEGINPRILFKQVWFFQFRLFQQVQFSVHVPYEKFSGLDNGSSYPDHKILCLKKHFSRRTSISEMKFRLWLFCRKLDHIHLIQLFLTGHCHVSCRHTRFIPCHEVLQLTDFLLLTDGKPLPAELSSLHKLPENGHNRPHNGSIPDFPYDK